MNESTCLTVALTRLESIVLPNLPLPMASFEEVDADRVFFGIRYYTYASIAHVRKILRGLIQVSDEANWACANILTRHLMEWAAHVTFLNVKVRSLVRDKRWDKAWAILLQLNGGDLYFRRFGAKYLGSDSTNVEIPEPFKTANFLNVYDLQHANADGRGSAQEDYSLLSELSHASAACLRQCLETRENQITFTGGDDDISPLPIASVSTIDWLMGIADLCTLTSDQEVGGILVLALRSINEAAPQH